MEDPLDRPQDAESVYIERGEPVPPWRPVMQGDVFAGITIPNAREHGAVLLVTHPCTMRGAAGALKPILQAAPVVSYQDVPLDGWRSGHFRVLPLPELRNDQPYAGPLGTGGADPHGRS